MRQAEIKRETTETEIAILLELDGTGQHSIDTGLGFLNHMLELFARHGRFNLTVSCKGDLNVDGHHTVEDVGIVLGRAFSDALGNRAGICRYGSFFLPMDEALVQVVLDISGRGMLVYGLEIPAEKIGDFDTETAEEFFMAFARSLGATVHLRQLSGKNSHHIVEAAFKGFARALKEAVAIDKDNPDGIPSTKGTIL